MKDEVLGGPQKTMYKSDCLKRGAWTVLGGLGEGLGKKEAGGVFEGGLDTPMQTLYPYLIYVMLSVI